MDSSFWLKKWEKNEIAFHNSEANPALVKHFPALDLAPGDRIFLPLCGKTLDIGWLLSQGYRVAGAELSDIAIEQLFSELGVEPNISPNVSEEGKSKHYSANNIDIFVGNIFDLSSEMLGPVDAIYDRAALVALPEEVRDRYTPHLKEITANAPQLLICFEYDQSLMAGPPFSISPQEVARHYKGSYALTPLESGAVPGGLKGSDAAKQTVWLLQSR